MTNGSPLNDVLVGAWHTLLEKTGIYQGDGQLMAAAQKSVYGTPAMGSVLD